MKKSFCLTCNEFIIPLACVEIMSSICFKGKEFFDVPEHYAVCPKCKHEFIPGELMDINLATRQRLFAQYEENQKKEEE